jgi:hypothetical protein
VDATASSPCSRLVSIAVDTTAPAGMRRRTASGLATSASSRWLRRSRPASSRDSAARRPSAPARASHASRSSLSWGCRGMWRSERSLPRGHAAGRPSRSGRRR